MTPNILIVGNICKDIIYSAAVYPKEDSKVKALDKEVRIRGNTGNIVQVLSQLTDCNVDCCVKLGSCGFSAHVSDTLREELRVRVMGVVEDGMDIPESILIHSEETSSRTCLHYRGNCSDLTCQEVLSALDELQKYHWIHLEHRRNGREVLELARKLKSVRPEVTQSIDIEKIREGFEEMLGTVDYPIVSKEVCKELGYSDCQAALLGLSKHCAKSVIVTWGDQGAGIWLKQGVSELKWRGTKCRATSDNTILCPAYPVEVMVDSIGAGDTFTAGFIYSVSHSTDGCTLPACLEAACRLAASKLGYSGMRVDKSVLG